MPGYTTKQVSHILGLTDSQIRSFVRSKLVEPARGPRNEYRFSFPDVIILRTVRELREAGVPPSRLHRALESLRARLPEGNALSSLSIGSDGDHVVVREQGAVWEPESGQLHIDFGVREVTEPIASLADRMIAGESERELSAEDWFEFAVELEVVSADKAMDAYRRALAQNPGHAFSHLNLGRILHEQGNVETAEGHYRQALAADPRSATAAFNLGVALEDLGRSGHAVDAYTRALKVMPNMASAHFNLARLYERAGRKKDALRHLAEYKRLDDIEEST